MPGATSWAQSPSTRPAEAAVASASDEERKARARELYKEGVAAQQRQDWRGAQRAFSQAWALTQHYQIAGNLGAVELELGRYRDAAGHLDYALRQMRADSTQSAETVAEVARLLELAKRHVAVIRLEARLFGTPCTDVELWVDGDRLGPIPPTLYLEPGERTLELRGPGVTSGARSIEAWAGVEQTLVVPLRLEGPTAPAAADSARPEAARGERAGGRPWWPVVVGGAVAVSAAGLAIGAGLAADAAGGDAVELADRLDERLPTVEAEVICSAPNQELEADCAAWRDARSTSGSWWSVTAGASVVAGAAAVATTLYLLWPDAETEPPLGEQAVLLVPWGGYSAGGLLLSGSF